MLRRNDTCDLSQRPLKLDPLRVILADAPAQACSLLVKQLTLLLSS
ncbi:hypothetical protein [Lacipirellula sp.]